MSAQLHRSRDDGRRMPRLVLAAALLACGALTACTAAPQTVAAPAARSADVQQLTRSSDGGLPAGTYLVTSYAVPFEITVPDGWEASADGWLLLKEPADGEAVFLNFPSVIVSVPADACQWRSGLDEVGATVAELTDALAAQASTTATSATDVNIGGYRGVEFDLAVESGVEVDDCLQEKICIHSEWKTDCSRYYQSVMRSETYRVLDLDGERAVMTVGRDSGASADDVKEARAIFDSVRFVTD